MKTIIGNTYKLIPIPERDRKDGVVYLSSSRVFRLLALDGFEAWVKCTETGNTFIVQDWRLAEF